MCPTISVAFHISLGGQVTSLLLILLLDLRLFSSGGVCSAGIGSLAHATWLAHARVVEDLYLEVEMLCFMKNACLGR